MDSSPTTESTNTPITTDTPAPTKEAPAPIEAKQYPVPKEVEARVVRLVSGLNDNSSVPKKLQELSKKYDFASKFGKAAYYLAVAYPKVDQLVISCKNTWTRYEKYDPQDLIPALIGFFMAFFGGSFLVTIAACEAFRASGAYHSTIQAVFDIQKDYREVIEADKKDNELDEDGDGIADVKQISNDELVKRKLRLVFKSVNPERVMNALGAIYAGFIAVIAALKIQFARALALGNSIGDVLTKPVLQYGEPKLDELIPAEYRKWNKHILSTICKVTSVMIAWFLQRVISTVHSAVKGGSLFSESLVNYLIKQGKLNVENPEKQREIEQKLSVGITILGVLFQFYMGWGLIFPLNILLLPFTMFEWFLTFFVNK
jgi:hypothetical protein